MLQVGYILTVNSHNYPDRYAVIDKRRSLSYAELNNKCNVLANALMKRGVTKGMKVGLLMKNSVDWIISWYATQKIGAVLVPLHERLDANDLAWIIRISECKVLVFDSVYDNKAAEIRSLCPQILVSVRRGSDGDPSCISWDGLFADPDETEPEVTIFDDDPSLILFTSGTTGAPKGVMRTQKMVALHAMVMAMGADNTRTGEVMLTTAKLYHAGGIVCVLKMLMMAGTLILPERADPVETIRMIEKNHVTQLMMLPPIIYERLYNDKEWQNHDLGSVREVCVSAGRCTVETAEHLFAIFPNCRLRPSWGSTETCSVTGMLLSKEELSADPSMINTVGRVNALTKIRIVDKNNRDVREGEVGEALVSSPLVFSGYLKEKKNHPDYMLDQIWFKTGDLIKKDPLNNCYYFIDRAKDIIKTGGENVAAMEIERIILNNPAVADCAVVGIPDSRFGEGIAAALVLKPGCKLNSEEFKAFCKDSMPGYKKPRYLAFVKKLPQNSVGKIKKDILREDWKMFKPLYTI